jgi:hypothetical protein
LSLYTEHPCFRRDRLLFLDIAILGWVKGFWKIKDVKEVACQKRFEMVDRGKEVRSVGPTKISPFFNQLLLAFKLICCFKIPPTLSLYKVHRKMVLPTPEKCMPSYPQNAYGVPGIIGVPRNVSVVPRINVLPRQYLEIP